MYLDAFIEHVGRYTWRPRLSKFGDELAAGYDRATLEENLEEVNQKAVGGRRASRWDSIHR
jgi:hypothetical protein